MARLQRGTCSTRWDSTPVNPASLVLAVGSPIFDNVTIHLPEYNYGGKDFVIEARNVSDENKYIQSALLNGEPLEKPWITHFDIAEGGKLTFEMTQIRTRNGVASRKCSVLNVNEEAALLRINFAP